MSVNLRWNVLDFLNNFFFIIFTDTTYNTKTTTKVRDLFPHAYMVTDKIRAQSTTSALL